MEELKISIPKPCHENWNLMKADERGRFCQSCLKTVIDFTKSSTIEIKSYFENNIGQRTCGRFRKEQLENNLIEIPNHILHQQTSFKKAFLLALFITMGTTLFSCKDQNDNSHLIEKIVVVEDSLSNSKEIQKQSILENDSIDKKDVKKISPPPKHLPQTMGIIVVEPNVLTGEVELQTLEVDSLKIYNLNEVEIKPIFQNGENDFLKYIIKNLILPKNIKYLIANVEFVINKNGKLENIKIIRGKNEEFNNNIKTLFENSPIWKPGEINGKKVNVKMIYPIRIKPQ